jgi:ribosomal protein S18 acetylase RimI-like enzyme
MLKVLAFLLLQHLYVHVVADNIAARRLYEDKLGFEIEKEEKEALARSLNRPRRLLLQKQL